MAFIDPKLVPKRKLSNGQEIPCMGMGTFGSDRFTPEQVSNAVAGAIRSGYRLFDCASVYGNEDLIGKVFEDAMKEGVVKREELFITSKVWNDMHGRGDVLLSCAQTLKDLRLDYLDFYFVHWPFPNYHAPGCDGDSRNPDSKPFSVDEFMSTWRQMERLVDMGLVRNIGMSSMTIPKLEAVLPLCRILPTVIEMELLQGVAVDGERCGRHVGCGACHARHVDVVCAALNPVAYKSYLLHEQGAAGGVVVPYGGLGLGGGDGGLNVAVADEDVACHAFESDSALRLGCVAECHSVEDPVHGVPECRAVGAVVEAYGCALVGGDADGAGCA